MDFPISGESAGKSVRRPCPGDDGDEKGVDRSAVGLPDASLEGIIARRPIVEIGLQPALRGAIRAIEIPEAQ